MQNSPATAMRLAVHTEGQGPPLLLFHGGVGSWTHWTRNIGVLGQHFTVHAVDLPACGDSPRVARDITDEGYIAALIEGVLAITHGESFFLAGFSFGAIAAAMVAARLDGRVQKLSLLGPGGFGKPDGRTLDLRPIPGADAGRDAIRAVLRHNLRVMMCADPASIGEDTIDLHHANVRRARFDSRRFSLSSYLPESLQRLHCPVQLIYGELDQLAYPSVQSRVDTCRAIMPTLQVNLIPRAGHWVQYEAADAVNAALIDFMR